MKSYDVVFFFNISSGNGLSPVRNQNISTLSTDLFSITSTLITVCGYRVEMSAILLRPNYVKDELRKDTRCCRNPFPVCKRKFPITDINKNDNEADADDPQARNSLVPGRFKIMFL